MSAIKNYMWDIGEHAADYSIEDAMKKYKESEEVVKACIMFVHAFDGNWELFVQEGFWQDENGKRPSQPFKHLLH